MPPFRRTRSHDYLGDFIIALINHVDSICNKIILQKQTEDKAHACQKAAWAFPIINSLRQHLSVPGLRCSFSIVAGQEFQIQNVNHTVIV